MSQKDSKRCARCPQSFNVWENRAKQTICPDCRFVLHLESEEARKAWAA